MGNVRLVEEVHTSEPRNMVDELQPGRELPQTPKTKPTNRPEMIIILGTVAKILGFRFQLFCAFMGAVILGWYAVYQHDPMALTAFGMYALMIFLPTLWVCHKRG